MLVLRHLEDRNVSEVAQLLGVSEGAVRNRSMRALDRVRPLLGRRRRRRGRAVIAAGALAAAAVGGVALSLPGSGSGSGPDRTVVTDPSGSTGASSYAAQPPAPQVDPVNDGPFPVAPDAMASTLTTLLSTATNPGNDQREQRRPDDAHEGRAGARPRSAHRDRAGPGLALTGQCTPCRWAHSTSGRVARQSLRIRSSSFGVWMTGSKPRVWLAMIDLCRRSSIRGWSLS